MYVDHFEDKRVKKVAYVEREGSVNWMKKTIQYYSHLGDRRRKSFTGEKGQ